MAEGIGDRIREYLIRKGYKDEVEEFEQAQKSILLENTIENRTAYRNIFQKLNSTFLEEVKKSQALGSWEDESKQIDDEFNAKQSKREEYKKKYGSQPEGMDDPEDAFRYQSAKEIFKNDPSSDNTRNVLDAMYKGDMSGVLSEQRRAEEEERKENLISHLKKSAQLGEEAERERQAKQKQLEADMKQKEKERYKAMSDKRLMRPADMEIPSSPLQRQKELEEERRKHRKSSSGFSGYNY